MNKKSFDIHKAAGIIVVERKLLVAREKGKEVFVSPGGSINTYEEPKDAVIRELMEEVSLVVKKDDIQDFGVFYAEAANDSGSFLKLEVFEVRKWEGDVKVNNEVGEIEEIFWLTSKIPEGMKVGSIFEHEVIPRLKRRGLID